MILSAHQPAYLPWLGYFDKIRRSDVFVYLDTVQFEKNSFTNRNRIKTASEPIWLTIPVKSGGHLSGTLLDMEIDEKQNWRDKHLRSIAQNYRKAPFFDANYPRLEALYAESSGTLADVCFQHLAFWLTELGIQTRIVRSQTLGIDSKKSDLVFDLCKHFGADHYLSGALGKDYLETDKFAAAGIQVEFQNYTPRPYSQLYGAFASHLAIVDLWMNMGPTAHDLIPGSLAI